MIFPIVILVLAVVLLIIGFITKKTVSTKQPTAAFTTTTSAGASPAPSQNPPTASTARGLNWTWLGWLLGGMAIAGAVAFLIFGENSPIRAKEKAVVSFNLKNPVAQSVQIKKAGYYEASPQINTEYSIDNKPFQPAHELSKIHLRPGCNLHIFSNKNSTVTLTRTGR